LKNLAPDRDGLLQLLYRWRKEASQAGRKIKRIAVAYEAGRDGFWLARWLRAHGIESHVIHPSSIPVSREHRRAKTDRLDAELLKRAFLGWLRGEPKHCSMAAIPTTEDEDARRPSREREILVKECTRIVNRVKANLVRLGIRGFRPALSQALKQLETVRTPEGSAVPANTLAEVRRDIASPVVRQAADQRNREDACQTLGTNTWRKTHSDGAVLGSRCRRRHRERRVSEITDIEQSGVPGIDPLPARQVRNSPWTMFFNGVPCHQNHICRSLPGSV